jgi:ComF family protein
MQISKFKNFILDLIFPRECAGCGEEGEWLCADCLQKIKFNLNLTCFHCQKTEKLGAFCEECAEFFYLNGIWAAGIYEDKILMRLIHNLKYYFAKDIGKILAEIIFKFLEKNNLLEYIRANKFVIMPVPLHQKRKKWRGFNQAEIIARALALKIGTEFIGDKLIRVKNKKSQTKLDKKERKDNVKDCFDWQGESLTGKKIILIDDVSTTGATLNECAWILKENDVTEVWGLVTARV